MVNYKNKRGIILAREPANIMCLLWYFTVPALRCGSFCDLPSSMQGCWTCWRDKFAILSWSCPLFPPNHRCLDAQPNENNQPSNARDTPVHFLVVINTWWAWNLWNSIINPVKMATADKKQALSPDSFVSIATYDYAIK